MPFVGDKGGDRFPEINRAKLLSAEAYAKAVGTGRPVRSASREEPDAERGSRHTGRGRRQAYSFAGASAPDDDGGFKVSGVVSGTAAPPKEKRSGWSRSGQMDLSTVNSYGFASRSQFFFPEAYKPLDTKFWQPLTEEQHTDIHMRQAQANLKATFTESDAMPIAATEADAQYADATSKRNMSMRRRRKPMNYDERKKDEEIKKKLPLTRKYVTGEAAFRESSQIVQSGPLDTPILVSGLATKPGQSSDNSPAPARLKRRRRTRRARSPEVDDQPQTPEQATLPTFDPKSAPRVRLAGRGHNTFGLKSRSELMYPEAYRDVSSVYWRKMSQEDQGRVMTVQAQAMEKVGYERGTQKQFIEEIEPEDDYRVKPSGRNDDTVRVGSGITAEGVMIFLVILACLAVVVYGVWRNFGDLVQ